MILPLLLALAAPATAPRTAGTVSDAAEREKVMAPLNAWFAGIDRADAAAIRSQLRLGGGGGAAVASVVADGTKKVVHRTWEEYLSAVKPGEHRYHEQFSGKPMIEIDGDIAMVWGAFTLFVDGKVTRCGVDHFDLIRENGRWLVQNVTWSQRTNCDPA